MLELLASLGWVNVAAAIFIFSAILILGSLAGALRQHDEITKE